MGSLSHVLRARTFLVLAGICAYLAYSIMPLPGFAGLFAFCLASMVLGFIAGAMHYSADSYDVWDFDRKCRVLYGRG